jgi:hypothetical protein
VAAGAAAGGGFDEQALSRAPVPRAAVTIARIFERVSFFMGLLLSGSAGSLGGEENSARRSAHRHALCAPRLSTKS